MSKYLFGAGQISKINVNFDISLKIKKRNQLRLKLYYYINLFLKDSKYAERYITRVKIILREHQVFRKVSVIKQFDVEIDATKGYTIQHLPQMM